MGSPAFAQPGNRPAPTAGRGLGAVRKARHSSNRAVAGPCRRARPGTVRSGDPERGPARVKPVPGRVLHPGRPRRRAASLADNKAAITEAAELGADTLVLVCGGLVPGSKDLSLARRMIADAIGELVPVAKRNGVRLGVEALHPMFGADRCVITRLGEALDLALGFPADAVGVVVDTYHVWWDAALLADIARAGDRIVSYQVCDWILPLPADTLRGRGHVGDGHIDFPPVTAAVTAAGYAGDIEVEIFSQAVWSAPPATTAALVRDRFPQIF